MKAIPFYIAVFFTLSQTQCKGQDHTGEHQSDQVRLTFRQYKMDTCLKSLLHSIVDVNSTHSHYPSSSIYYSLQFEEATSYRRIIIIPKYWTKDLARDCTGIIEVNGMSFVCCGALEKSNLFIDLGVELTKDIQLQSNDSLEILRENDFLDWKNSPTALVGSYHLCHGSPIDLYINVGSKLRGVEMKK